MKNETNANILKRKGRSDLKKRLNEVEKIANTAFSTKELIICLVFFKINWLSFIQKEYAKELLGKEQTIILDKEYEYVPEEAIAKIQSEENLMKGVDNYICELLNEKQLQYLKPYVATFFSETSIINLAILELMSNECIGSLEDFFYSFKSCVKKYHKEYFCRHYYEVKKSAHDKIQEEFYKPESESELQLDLGLDSDSDSDSELDLDYDSELEFNSTEENLLETTLEIEDCLQSGDFDELFNYLKNSDVGIFKTDVTEELYELCKQLDLAEKVLLDSFDIDLLLLEKEKLPENYEEIIDDFIECENHYKINQFINIEQGIENMLQTYRTICEKLIEFCDLIASDNPLLPCKVNISKISKCREVLTKIIAMSWKMMKEVNQEDYPELLSKRKYFSKMLVNLLKVMIYIDEEINL